MTPNWKPLASVRRLAKQRSRLALKTHERLDKRQSRQRDGYRCRFPLCGCRRLGLRLESAHLVHKGAGGDPSGDRSRSKGLITLCVQRHQDGAVSWHHGTLRARSLTALGADGPLGWLVDMSIIDGRQPGGALWMEVARESAVQQLEPLNAAQREILARLTRMEL